MATDEQNNLVASKSCCGKLIQEMAMITFTFVPFFKRKFLMDTCPFMGSLIPLFLDLW